MSRTPRRPGRRLALWGEVVAGGLGELWAHRLRSGLTLTLLMLGVFTLVVMGSVLGGILDKVGTGFKGLGWDGVLELQGRRARTLEEGKRFGQSPGLRLEDLPRLTVPDGRILAFLPRAAKQVDLRVGGGTEPTWVSGHVPDYLPVMGRRIASGRGLTADDQRRHSPVAVLGASLAARIQGGADPVGREILVGGVPFRVVGVLAPMIVMSMDTWMDSHGVLVPLEAFMDRLEPSHRLDALAVKLAGKRHLASVPALLLARARQAHHGIEDVEVKDLDADGARAYAQFRSQMRGWRLVFLSLAGTVLLVGGVGVLSVMLISCSDRRFEIGLRKALGATDREILGQFLLEATVLAALGALAGTLAGTAVCEALSPRFPFGLKVEPLWLAGGWITALALGLVFGLYPALRAMRLSPTEAMR